MKLQFLEKFSCPLQRYGNPTIPFLGTLKNKIQIQGFSGSLIKNLRSFRIFRVPFYSVTVELAQLWEPWKSNYDKYYTNLMSLNMYGTILLYEAQERSWILSLQIANDNVTHVSHNKYKLCLFAIFGNISPSIVNIYNFS